mmetsp:Transcript_103578/g.205884  ORF Transcript_103578/g.205884 Transcript_103578/m.205884 type:complete len:202 (+) Transcript_103578:1272-1877(+)
MLESWKAVDACEWKATMESLSSSPSMQIAVLTACFTISRTESPVSSWLPSSSAFAGFAAVPMDPDTSMTQHTSTGTLLMSSGTLMLIPTTCSPPSLPTSSTGATSIGIGVPQGRPGSGSSSDQSSSSCRSAFRPASTATKTSSGPLPASILTTFFFTSFSVGRILLWYASNLVLNAASSLSRSRTTSLSTMSAGGGCVCKL